MDGANLFPIFFLDAPEILTCAVTNIPGSGGSPLQVVAHSGVKAARAIQYTDTTGDYIGVYTGAIGQETLRTIIGGGAANAIVPVVIAVGSRVSLRSMTASAITNGLLTITFLGVGWSGGSAN